MKELKPCPFCGGKAKVGKDTDIFFEAYCVSCLKCGVSQQYPKYYTEEAAIEAWNSRAGEEE